VALVDLRGHEHDEAVRPLLSIAHGSRRSVEEALARYADGDLVLVGWDEGGGLVACAGLERLAPSEICIRSGAVLPERRGRGVGRTFLDALAEVAAAERLVADADDGCADFYRGCGFAVAEVEPGRFRCSRIVESTPAAPESVRAFTLGELESAIRDAWGRDTSDDPDEWSDTNPARGQCAVTALLVRDLVGGEILIANVLRDGRRVERHAWNRLPSGLSLDLTRSQFANGEEYELPVPGEPLLASRARYELFAGRVRDRLGL
jgi:GNAT superfamily N-acetyltransferase